MIQRPQQSRRSACDRCRNYKLRCDRASLRGNSCERCVRAGTSCTTTTTKGSESRSARGSHSSNQSSFNAMDRIYSTEIPLDLTGEQTTGESPRIPGAGGGWSTDFEAINTVSCASAKAKKQGLMLMSKIRRITPRSTLSPTVGLISCRGQFNLTLPISEV